MTKTSSRDPNIQKVSAKSSLGRLSKSTAQGDFDELAQQYPVEKGWTERERRRAVRKYPDGLWYAESFFFRIINDTVLAR